MGSLQERHRDDREVTLVLERICLLSSVSAGRRPHSLQAGMYIGRRSVSETGVAQMKREGWFVVPAVVTAGMRRNSTWSRYRAALEEEGE